MCAAYLRLLALCLFGGIAFAAPATNEIIITEVKMENVTFQKAFSDLHMLLQERDLQAAIDTVHDIPENFDNPRAFTLVGKNLPLSDLLTSFCRYYGLEWSRRGETIVFSLPRPRP
jgi:hypothetical protein